MRRFKEYKGYGSALDLIEGIYRATSAFPEEELYGLSSQLRRAAVSIASNVAEGAGRPSEREFIRFLRIALSSANEVDCQLEVARRLGFLSKAEHGDLSEILTRVTSQLGGLLRAVSR